MLAASTRHARKSTAGAMRPSPLPHDAAPACDATPNPNTARKPQAAAMRAKRFARMAVALLAALSLAFCLQGCKDTDVLTEHIEDQVNGILDEAAEPIYEEVAGAPEDPARISTRESDNDNLAEQENTQATFDEDPTTEDETEEREQEDNASDWESTQGDEQNPEGDDASLSGDRTGDGMGGEGSESGAPGEGDSTDTATRPSGQGGPAEVFDPSGVNQQLPDDVSTIAATGQYAIITQMLGGSGGLVAADAATLEKIAASGAFPGEGTENIAVGWSGAGNEAGSIDLDAIISSGADCVLTSNTASNLTEADRAALLEAGIDVLLMPDIGTADTPDANIVQAVQLIGDVLRGSPNTAYDAADMAARYVQMHDETISACVQQNGGYSYKFLNNASYTGIYQGTGVGMPTANVSSARVATAFIDSWYGASVGQVASQRVYSRVKMAYLSETTDMLDCSDGVGMSMPGSATGNFPLIDYYLQCSGVVNNAYEGYKPASSLSEGGVSLPTPVVAGSTLGLGLEGLITPRGIPSGLWFSQTGDQDSLSAWTLVGDGAFPGVIVRDDAIAQSLLSSASKVNGFYNVGQSYYVYVMPSGLAGSWADGTVESFLTAPWAYGCFQSGNDFTSASTYVDNYCQLFYRCGAASAMQHYNDGGSLQAICPTS